jgi:crotonobetainyl-CoA:carnitine CoA-transferase CaiB-like acyl-CoA transferase
MGTPPLGGYGVVDLSSGIAGAYCTKLLADGGADVIKVEDPSGDWLRGWTACGAQVADGDDGALFQFLHGSQRSVVANPGVPDDEALVADLVRRADAVVWTAGSAVADLEQFRPERLRALAPDAVVCAITPFGLTGPWAQRPATEATLQAMAGGLMTRGDPSRPPVLEGGEAGEWIAGMTAAVGLLMARWRGVHRGGGDLVDVSAFESLVATMTMHPVTYATIAGSPMRANRLANLPAIHATKDGFVGFMVVTGQQWLDFCVLIEQPGWLEDESLIRFQTRARRRPELLATIDSWMATRSTAEVLELADALRIPAAEVGTGATIPHFEQLAAREWFVRNPQGQFLQPDVPYTLYGNASRRPAEPSPRLGEHTAEARERLPESNPPSPTSSPGTLPFEGLRVLDVTNNWAGPEIGRILAMFGADVIHVESPRRPDPIRHNSIRELDEPEWWEWSPQFHGPNADKRSLTLDLSDQRGRSILLRLAAQSDVFVENFSPRVVESWRLDYPVLQEANPAIIMLRAPAWGIRGPWRDRTGYAQTMEMGSGLAWLTGWPDEPPEIPNGPMDPIAGAHGLLSLLLALEHRRRTGEGSLVEAPMIGGALSIAAQQVIEYSAYGQLLGRVGNRSWRYAPQSAYRTADPLPDGQPDRWVMISVADDAQWAALRGALGDPDWARDAAFDHVEGRHRGHDALDVGLAAWCATRSSSEVVEHLTGAGVPASVVLRQDEPGQVPQLRARGFFEPVEHPVTGRYEVLGYPARLASAPRQLHRHAAPTLGQHNKEILGGTLGMTDDEMSQLEKDGVIGTRPTAGGVLW